MTKKRLLAFLLLLCAVFTAGCAAAEGNGGDTSSLPAVVSTSEEASGTSSESSEEPGKISVTWEDISAENLLAGINREELELTAVERPYQGLMTNLGVKLMQETVKADPDGENKLISPLSVLYAMAMVSNGGDDTQALKAFWGDNDLLHINEFMLEYAEGLPRGDEAILQLANSVWVAEEESFTASQDFLQKVKSYYNADVFRAPFNQETCKDINEWVELKTNGMIKDILDQIPPTAVMYLVNALAFEAEWLSPYEATQVREGVFTKADGTKQSVDFMYSTLSQYYEDEKATGFLRYYKGKDYAFVAMLPKEGVTPEEYIASLDGNALHTMLKNPVNTSVITSIPVFEANYEAEMRDILGAVGYPVDGSFNGIGTSSEGPLEIGRILHKTYIQVGTRGTKAGAATVVEELECAVEDIDPEEPKVVHLDRPFVYMIIDCENAVPLFMGITHSVAN